MNVNTREDRLCRTRPCTTWWGHRHRRGVDCGAKRHRVEAAHRYRFEMEKRDWFWAVRPSVGNSGLES